MVNTIITVVITFIVSSLLTWTVSIVKRYNNQSEAIKCLLRANIVNQYYVYKEIGKIPFYVKESLHKEYEAYKGLNGNSFVSDLMKEIDEWEIM